MRTIRDRALGLVIGTAFVLAWFGQSYSGWKLYAQEQAAHDLPGVGYLTYIGTSDFWAATFENWQSEFLQWGAVVWLTVWLVHKGSAESRDSDERIEAKIDALLRDRGQEPMAVEATLPEKFRDQ
jgi:hypothetical protein